MKNRVLALSLLIGIGLMSCEEKEVGGDTGEGESQYKESGYVVASVNESTGGYNYYAGYLETLDASTPIDMTTKSTYNYLYSRFNWKNFMYGTSLTGDQKLSKIGVNKEGKLVEVASIPLLSTLNNVAIIDDNLGVYVTWNSDRYVGLFNPTTMESLGSIDMSKGFKSTVNERNFYNNIIYRKQDNRLFLTVQTDNPNTAAFYDSPNVYVEVVNLAARKWEKTIVYEGASYPITRGNEHQIVDESGNIYIFTQGSYGLDGQMGPQAAKNARPQILKIPANTTEFDASYSFNPVNVIGQQNLLVQLMLGGIYDSNGIAYSCISAQSDSPRILELVMKYATGKATEAEYLELRNSIFYSEAQRWVKLDLNSKTVSPVEDIPVTAGFAYPNAYKYDGKFYFQYNTPTDKTTGYYEYDPSTGKARRAVVIKNGGIITDFVKLSE